MGKIISDTWAGPDDPIFKEPLRSYSPHWARAYLKSKKNSPASTDGPPTAAPASENPPASKEPKEP
jgi:hypothetical protein